MVPAGEGGLQIRGGQIGSHASRDLVGNRPETEQTSETRWIEPVVGVGGIFGSRLGVPVGAGW